MNHIEKIKNIIICKSCVPASHALLEYRFIKGKYKTP